ncbi:hypothetical protein IWQ60_011377, partial [Tieghemiomyces parasiticus]
MRATKFSLYGLFLAAVTAASAAADGQAVVPNRYIVRFRNSVARSSATTMSEADITKVLDKSGIEVEVKHTYSNPTFNAASVVITGDDTQAIQDLNEVADVWPVSVMTLPSWKGESL